jgi:malate synthase
MTNLSTDLKDRLNESLKTGRIEIQGPVTEAHSQILTPAALAFLAALARRFESRRRELLAARKARHEQICQGVLPDFLPETAEIREGEWTVGPIPDDLSDRRVEITGPVDRKMIINALNSDASVFMADSEDSNSPTWQNNVDGQVNLRDAVSGTIEFVSTEGKHYAWQEGRRP